MERIAPQAFPVSSTARKYNAPTVSIPASAEGSFAAKSAAQPSQGDSIEPDEHRRIFEIEGPIGMDRPPVFVIDHLLGFVSVKRVVVTAQAAAMQLRQQQHGEKQDKLHSQAFSVTIVGKSQPKWNQ